MLPYNKLRQVLAMSVVMCQETNGVLCLYRVFCHVMYHYGSSVLGV